MIQVVTFDKVERVNEWLSSHTELEILKYYSNGPDYFFIVYDIDG
jgi:hypothetical protein